MKQVLKNANGNNISKLIYNFNSNIENLYNLKIKVLEPSDDENIANKNFLQYESLKEFLKENLREIAFINENYFFHTLTEFVAILFEKLYHIIDMK